MTIYLRDNLNRDVADIEVGDTDVRAVVPLMGYSLLLLAQNGLEAKAQCIADFEQVQNLRRWYFESFWPDPFTGPQPSQEETVAAIKGILEPLAARYGLTIVTD